MYTIPASVLGLTVSGDLGGTTIYTDRWGRKTVYPFSPPKEPPSPRQIRQRSRFALAQASWRALSSEAKADLERVVAFYSLCATGQNIWISACMTNRNAALQTMAAGAGISLPEAPYVP